MEITEQLKSDTKMADDAFLHKIDDEPSTLAGIKRLTPNIPKDLQDIVVETAGRLPEGTRLSTSFTEPTDLEDNMKRWLLVGVCLNSILIPALREYLVPILTFLYNELTCNHKIDLQKYPTHLKRYPQTNDFLNYEAVNSNKTIHGNKKEKYDYKIRNAVELSKLFLQSHMGHYTGFDETCDSSAVLELIIKIDKFPSVVKSDAEDVKRYIGNIWARFDFSVWNAVKYSDSFQMMEKLVKELSLSFDKEVQLAEEIQVLKIYGQYFYFGPEMIEEVRHIMVRLVVSLKKLPKETDDDSLRIKKEDNIGNIIQTLYDLGRPRRHHVGYTFKGREVRMAGEEPYDLLFAKSIRTNVFGAKPTRIQDDVEINGYKGANNEDKFYKLNVVCDSFVVDCIVDRKLNRTCIYTVKEFQECIEENKQYAQSDFHEKVKEKFLSFVEKRKSCLCQYFLKHTSNNAIETHTLVNALHSSIKNDDVDTAKFIGWQIARNFRQSCNMHVYDIWLASLCSCSRLKKRHFSWFCSTNVTIIIMVPHFSKQVLNHFCGLPIRQILYHCDTFKEARAISDKRTRLLERNLNIQCHVPGPLAEQLFNNHRRLSLVCPSEIKSIEFKDFPEAPTFLNCSCIQLFCYVKGSIPIGERHFPGELQGIPTDVIEGFSRFCSNHIRIGDSVTNTRMKGTLGGFCRFYGREAFLTCAHAMMDWDTLLSIEPKHHIQKESVHVYTGVLDETLFCGKVVNHSFTHGCPKETSTDVALVEIDNGISISEDDFVNTRGNRLVHCAELGLKSRYLQDGYIRSLHELPGQKVEVVCAGAVSGLNGPINSLISKAPNSNLEREDLNFASTNLEIRSMEYLHTVQVNTSVHMQVKAIIYESRKEESESDRALRFYNQLAVHKIPFQQGDSGACVYINKEYTSTKTGCLGMAIANLPGGGCIVTPMVELLEKLDLI